MNWKHVCWGVAAGVACAQAGAVDSTFRPNPAEILRLPPYCQAKFNAPQGSAEWKAWRDRIGENFIDLHHYCAGLNYVSRYWGARSPQDRGHYLQRALDNFSYMARAEKPDFALSAELYSNRGEVYRLMRKPGEAIQDYSTAIARNPGLVKPYLQLAELHVANKAPSRALEAVSEGLRHVPDSTALQRRYLELGGKKPFPEPVAAKTAEPAPAADVPAAQPEPSPAQDAAPAETKPEPAAAETARPAIGTPKNPYCRFCPPEE